MPTTKSAKKKSAAPSKASSSPVTVLVATRKGAFFLKSDAARKSWKIGAPIFLGHIVHHMVQDPREPKTILAAARTGHLGPTIFRSNDSGKTWKEAKTPPAFPKAPEGKKGQVVDHTFWLTPGHASEKRTWYAGTSPQGLFRSEDGGETWNPVNGLNEHPEYSKWMGAFENGTPNGPKLHSVLVDPRDARHLYCAMSSGGVFESTDAGASWKSLIAGLEVVESLDVNVLMYHDPHCMRFAGTNPDRLYQQNHCGIYRIDRPGETWTRVGKAMPKAIGDVGFTMTVHPRDADTMWVLPMDGSGVWPRTSPGGKPAVFVSKNGGKSWTRQAAGMPAKDAYWTVKRQAMCADAGAPVGLYFGTTSGEVWASRDEGAKWTCIARNLPEIYAVESAR